MATGFIVGSSSSLLLLLDADALTASAEHTCVASTPTTVVLVQCRIAAGHSVYKFGKAQIGKRLA